MIRRAIVPAILAASLTLAACSSTPQAPSFPTWSDGVAACQEEDGSTPGQPFPCRWESARSGNGLGSLDYTLTGPDTLTPEDAATRYAEARFALAMQLIGAWVEHAPSGLSAD